MVHPFLILKNQRVNGTHPLSVRWQLNAQWSLNPPYGGVWGWVYIDRQWEKRGRESWGYPRVTKAPPMDTDHSPTEEEAPQLLEQLSTEARNQLARLEMEVAVLGGDMTTTMSLLRILIKYNTSSRTSSTPSVTSPPEENWPQYVKYICIGMPWIIRYKLQDVISIQDSRTISMACNCSAKNYVDVVKCWSHKGWSFRNPWLKVTSAQILISTIGSDISRVIGFQLRVPLGLYIISWS